jgi:hypothetical protein
MRKSSQGTEAVAEAAEAEATGEEAEEAEELTETKKEVTIRPWTERDLCRR